MNGAPPNSCPSGWTNQSLIPILLLYSLLNATFTCLLRFRYKIMSITKTKALKKESKLFIKIKKK